MDNITSFHKEYIPFTDLIECEKTLINKLEKYNYKFIVYLLVNDNNVIYIGISNSIKVRMYGRRIKKQFDKFYLILCDNYLSQHNIEKLCIEFFKPNDNKMKYKYIYNPKKKQISKRFTPIVDYLPKLV